MNWQMGQAKGNVFSWFMVWMVGEIVLCTDDDDEDGDIMQRISKVVSITKMPQYHRHGRPEFFSPYTIQGRHCLLHYVMTL